MPSPETKKLAEKIAKLLDPEPQGGDLATLFASIEKINHRLDKLEARPETLPAGPGRPDRGAEHPSVERFNVAEAIADSIFSHYKKEKACQFEPGKPCDHCAMCSARGF